MRWLKPVSWHLTLLFLGSRPLTEVAAMASMVDVIGADSHPIEISIEGGDGRLKEGRGAAWLKVAQGAAELLALADRLQEQVEATLADSPASRRTPAAHLTVVRDADAKVIAALRQQRHGPIEAGWSADRIGLVRSYLEPSGARYETLHEARCTLPGTASISRQEVRRPIDGEEVEDPWH